MIVCHNCNRENKIDKEICSYCGKKLKINDNIRCLEGGTFLDKRYEIIELINSGGMGAVYRAKDDRLDDICAVKEMMDLHTDPGKKKQAIKNFKDEARIITKLRHPGLPRIRDYFIENDRYYLVMDFVEGQDLENLWGNTRGKKFQEKEVIEWSLQILKLLDYLHTQNPPIVYRDVKPSNIMLKKNSNEIVLIDFGIARIITPKKSERSTSSGTLGYCPPEQYEGMYTPQSDIYSLGATMHQLLSGEVPLVPFKFGSICEKNPTVSRDIENIIMKALTEKPEERFKSAREMMKSIIDVYKTSKDQHAAAIALKYEIETQLTSSTALMDMLRGNGELSIAGVIASPLDHIDLLIIELSSSSVEMRRLAIDTLAKYTSERVLKGILKSLNDTDIEVRKKAVCICGNRGNSLALGQLINLLDDETEEVRVYAAEALGRIMDLQAVKPLIKSLADPSPAVRKQVAQSLGMLGDREAIRPLEEARKKEGLLSLHMKEVMGKAIERLIKGPSGEEWIEMGKLYLFQGKISPAEESFKKAIELREDLVESYINLGNIYAFQGNFLSAEKFYTNAISLCPQSGELRNSLGNIYARMGQTDRAIEEYKKAIELSPSFATAYNNLGFAYYNQGELYNAIVEYRKALELDETLSMAYNNLGNAYSALKNYELAIDEYHKAIKLQPDLALAHNNLGFAYASMNKHELALPAYQEALKYAPEFAMAYNNLAFSYGVLKNFDMAIKNYKKAIDLYSENPAFYSGLARIYHQVKNPDMAIENCKKAIELTKKDSLLYEFLATLYMEKGKFHQAIKEYRKAITLNPANTDLYNEIGCIYNQLEQYEEAIMEYKRALAINSGDAKLYSNLGYSYTARKEYDKAIYQYITALRLSPENPSIYYNLGCAYLGQKKYREAMNMFKEVMEISENEDLIKEVKNILLEINGESH